MDQPEAAHPAATHATWYESTAPGSGLQWRARWRCVCGSNGPWTALAYGLAIAAAAHLGTDGAPPLLPGELPW